MMHFISAPVLTKDKDFNKVVTSKLPAIIKIVSTWVYRYNNCLDEHEQKLKDTIQNDV